MTNAEHDGVPPIPVYLRHRPTVGGLVIPFTVLRHRNGDAALGLVDSRKISLCLHERRCGVCGRVMHDRMVFLLRESDLDRNCSVEPGMCPPCAAYTQRACPMIAGRMRHYRRTQPQFLTRQCADPACPCRLWAVPPEPDRYGAAAEPWYALWTRQYTLIRDDRENLAARFDTTRVLTVRQVR